MLQLLKHSELIIFHKSVQLRAVPEHGAEQKYTATESPIATAEVASHEVILLDAVKVFAKKDR